MLPEVRFIKEVNGKILVCYEPCNYDVEHGEGQHSEYCRYGTLSELTSNVKAK